MEITPEQLLLKYALPHLSYFDLLKLKGVPHEKLAQLTREIITPLEAMALGDGTNIDWALIERAFPYAIEQIGNPLNAATIREYFLEKHNDLVLADPKIPLQYKELCIIQIAEIMRIGEGYFSVRYGRDNNRIKRVKSCFVSDAKVGDKVIIHYLHAVEKAE